MIYKLAIPAASTISCMLLSSARNVLPCFSTQSRQVAGGSSNFSTCIAEICYVAGDYKGAWHICQHLLQLRGIFHMEDDNLALAVLDQSKVNYGSLQQ